MWQLFAIFSYFVVVVHCELSASQVNSLIRSINSATQTKGGVYADYSCKTVSWDDADRGTFDDGQGLSAWGDSITDTRLWAKDGTLLFTVRSDNWNEKLGHVNADDVKIIVGNEEPGKNELKTISLGRFLREAGVFGGYAGLPANSDLSNSAADNKVSIRFQTTFLPVEDKDKATLEFATEAYNYNTMSDDDPKNIVVLATTQGIAVQQDGKGAKKLYHHDVDENRRIHRYWLEAERTKHKVGGSQKETEEERKDANQRGKATAKEIGIPAMGKRFNVLMTIQVPLNQTTAPPVFQGGLGAGCPGCLPEMSIWSVAGPPPNCPPGVNSPNCISGVPGMPDYPDMSGVPPPRMMPDGPNITPPPKEGTANAARVSRGSEVDVWDGLTVEDPKRHPKQHVTVTAVIYNTIAGGVPKLSDVVAAIDDMERLYKACDWNGRLIDKEANFMKTELTNGTLGKIIAKVGSQPYTFQPLPPPVGTIEPPIPIGRRRR